MFSIPVSYTHLDVYKRQPEWYPLYGIHIRQPQSPTQAFYQFCYKSENLNVLLDSLHTDKMCIRDRLTDYDIVFRNYLANELFSDLISPEAASTKKIIDDSNKPLMNLFANQSWSLPFKDNQVDIYTDGYDLFLTLLYNIGQAKHHIHLDTYIFEADALGYLIADALIDKEMCIRDRKRWYLNLLRSRSVASIMSACVLFITIPIHLSLYLQQEVSVIALPAEMCIRDR